MTTPRRKTENPAPEDATGGDPVLTDAGEAAADAAQDAPAQADTTEAPAERAPADFPRILPGSTGPAVEDMQRLLGVPVTGYYDSKVTRPRVDELRAAQDLKPTGVFDAELAQAIANTEAQDGASA